MAGTKKGGQKASLTNRTKYGEDYYKKMGSRGGKAGKGEGYKGGFANPNASGIAKPATAGAVGGKYSRKGYKLLSKTEKGGIYRNKTTGEIVEIKI